MILRALILRHVVRDPLRSLITLLSVALGVALVLAIDLANATAVASFSQSVNIVARKVNIQLLGVGNGFDERIFARVLNAPGVRDARPVIEGTVALDARRGRIDAGEVLHIYGTDLLRPLPDPQDVVVPAGPVPDVDVLVNGGGAFVSDRLARRYHVRPGSQLTGLAGDRQVRLRIAGILPPETAGIDSSVVFVDIATAQELFGRSGLLDRIDLEADPASRAAVTRELQRIVPPGVRIVTPQTRNAEIGRMLQSFAVNLAALAVIALLVGAFLVFNTVAISVVRRRREVGILRGLGAPRSMILGAFLFEGAVFGIAGTALGMLFGALLAKAAVGAVSRTVATLYVSTHADGVAYSAMPFLKAAVLGIGSSIAAAFVPAREAARVLPAALMKAGTAESRGLWKTPVWLIAAGVLALLGRGLAALPAIDSLPLFGYAAALCIIGAGIAVTPPLTAAAAALLARTRSGRWITLALAATNMRSARGRVSVAVVTLMTAIGMMVSIAILVGSFRTTVVAWAAESLRADIFIRPLGLVDADVTASLSPALEGRIRRLPAVAAVDTFRALTVPYAGRLTTIGATEMSELLARPRLRILGGVRLADYATGLQNGRAILISEPFAVRFGTKAGDTLILPTALGPRREYVAAVYNDYSSDNGVILMDRAAFARVYADRNVDSLAVYAKSGTDLITLRNQIYRLAAPSRIDVESTRELRKYVIEIFDRTFAITYALYVIAIVIAVLGVVSTLFALVLERRREIGILRSLGLRISGVRSMILFEAASIGALGGVTGIAVGVALALDLIFVINRQSFGWLIELTMPWNFLIMAFVTVIAVAALAGIIPANIAAGMNTAEVLREDS